MFETERCSINAFQKSDVADVKKVYVNQEVRKFLGGIRQEAAIEVILDNMVHTNEDESYNWVVREKQTGDFMGLISIGPHHDGNYLEISYQFLPNWWGKGYATETVQLIIDYALHELNLSKIVAETQTVNTTSRRLLQRLGMEFERKVSRFGAEQAIYSIEK